MLGFSKIEGVLKKTLAMSIVITIILFVIGSVWKPLAHSFVFITIFMLVAIIILEVFKREESKKIPYKLSDEKESAEIFDLSESEQTRSTIIKLFNSKYRMNLSDKQIRQIVTASYTSYYWAREVFDMSKEYVNVRSWIRGETDWLRIYLYAFPSLNIISDFKAQYGYVLDVYKKIFDKIDTSNFLTMEDYLNEVNRKYFASLDENMFVQVVRFMRKNGYDFNYPTGIYMENESEEEKIMKKYE